MPNNVGDPTDSSGQIAVDFAWGPFPIQSNSDRAGTATNSGGTVTRVVTAASNGSTNTTTYTVTSNTIPVGAYVRVTGLSNWKFNVDNAKVLTSSSTQITVLNPTANGESNVTGATGSAVTEGDYSWGQTTQVASARLDASLDNHAIVESGHGGYPSYTPAEGNYIVTAATGNGTTVTYTSQNFLAAGQAVNITGLTASAYNLSGVTVASSNATSFTVTNSANAGLITGQVGKVQSTTAASAGDGAGEGNVLVPSVLGLATASALDGLQDRGFELANITNTTGVTNTAKSITRINVTAAGVAAVYATAAHTAYPTGTKVSIGAGTGIPTALVGTWTVTGTAGTGQITIAGSGWTVADTGSITPSASLTGTTGTVITQNQAAGTAVATTGTITITSWA